MPEPSNSELLARIEALEKSHLSIGDIQAQLQNDWTPNADTTLLPQSVGPNSLSIIPYCHVDTFNSIPIDHGAATTITWGRKLVETYPGMFTATAVRVPLDGVYAVTVWALWPLNATGDRDLLVYSSHGGLTWNTPNVSGADSKGSAGTSNGIDNTVTIHAAVTKGDYFSAQVTQLSGVSLDVSVTMQVVWLGNFHSVNNA